MVIESIHSGTEITFGTAPAVFLGTLLTHISGGSSGREGAALQLGGSIGNQIGKVIRLDEKDMKIAVMCGMSGAFAALFGTPMAAAVFSMEVISIGVMYYAALVPCIFSSFIGAAIAKHMQLMPEAVSYTHLYSIIGQGQIDKILSGKPEERRELFDEAAGIVKFKRRKLIAQKKLEDEKQNLLRVSDILAELEKQVGPLARQSEAAREYLLSLIHI